MSSPTHLHGLNPTQLLQATRTMQPVSGIVIGERIKPRLNLRSFSPPHLIDRRLGINDNQAYYCPTLWSARVEEQARYDAGRGL